MPIRTRQQAAAAKIITSKEVDKVPILTDVDHDSWDVPEINLQSSIVKTYSKKKPFRTYQFKKLSKNTQDSSGVSSKPDVSTKPPRTKLTQETLSSSTKKAPTSTKKAPSTASKNSTKLPSKIPTVQTTKRSGLKRARNKTRLAVESMTTCTILAENVGGIDLTTDDMSLCSVVQMGMKSRDNKNIKNSTCLAGCGAIVNDDFVPNEISAIEGQSEFYDTVISNCSEGTPENQPVPTAVQSVKKVRFDVSQKTPKNQTQPAAKRYAIRKSAPYWNEMLDDGGEKYPETPKTSSPDPNRDTSTLHCEISSLLIEDDTSREHLTKDTAKLLDFEPVPLQSSKNVFDEDARDVTPETCDSVKAQTSSAKRRRRLCYYLDEEEIPACVLLDIPVRKTKKKCAVWTRKNAHAISIEELESFPDDILL